MVTAQAPVGVLEKLREIDSRAQLVHLGGTSWWLGVDETNLGARDQLLRSLAQTDVAESALGVSDAFERALTLDYIAKEHRMLQIMAYGVDGGSGFRPIEIRECPKLEDFYELVEDFRRADYIWKTQGVKRFMTKMNAVKERSLATLDRIRQDARSWWHHFMRRRVSILNSFGPRKGPVAKE